MTVLANSGAIRVSYGVSRPAAAPDAGGGVAMVAVVPFDSPWYADVLPALVVREARHRESACSFEHLRLTHSSDFTALPRIDGPWRSRIRDSVASALSAGAPCVDLLLLRAEDAEATDFTHPLLREQLASYLPQLPGGVVVFPDAGLGPAIDQWRLARMLAPHLAENHVIGLLDPSEDVEPERLAEALVGFDVAVCRWTGRARTRSGHAWRSAAAVVAGRMCADANDIGRSLCRRAVPLRAPVPVRGDRWRQLTPYVRGAPEVDRHPDTPLCVDLDYDDLTNSAVIQTEPALRAPVGVWTLPAMQATKAIRRAVAEAAGRHLFRPITDQEAYALAGGIMTVMRPFLARGLLTGPGGAGVPEVVAGVVRDPSFPGLVAVVRGYLRPWMHLVDLSVNVRHGESATVTGA